MKIAAAATTLASAATLAAAALLAGPILAQRGDTGRLPEQCRAEVRAVCGGGGERGALRECLRTRSVEVSDTCRTALRDWMAARGGEAGVDRRQAGAGSALLSLPAAPQTLAYGSDSLQGLDLWVPESPRPAPLVLFVHGGGWKRGSKDNATSRALPAHLLAQGYAFASIDYRLVPRHRVEDQAADVAAALAHLLQRAEALGIDRRRVVLAGHSAGAHLVALVGTDERYLRAAGLSFADIRGVMPNDGAGYDVAAQLAAAGPLMRDTYRQAFGTDPERHKALSPTAHAAAPNAPAFLLLHVQRPDAIAQSQGLAEALRRAGTAVEIGSVEGEGLRGHMEINRRLGQPDYPVTAMMDAWLKSVLGA